MGTPIAWCGWTCGTVVKPAGQRSWTARTSLVCAFRTFDVNVCVRIDASLAFALVCGACATGAPSQDVGGHAAVVPAPAVIRRSIEEWEPGAEADGIARGDPRGEARPVAARGGSASGKGDHSCVFAVWRPRSWVS